LGTPYDPRICMGTSCRAPVAGACCGCTAFPKGNLGIRSWWAIPVKGANRGPLRRIRTIREILASAI